MADFPARTYADAGVDTQREEEALTQLIRILSTTWPQTGHGRVVLPIGYFANVLDLGGIGVAVSADGVGSKVLIAQMMGKYDTIGIDCVAMNVNDLLCVGATPVAMLDYIALQDPRPDLVAALARGLRDGAHLANISIPGGEIAQLRDIVKGHTEGYGFDIAGMAIGTVRLDRIIIGQDLQPDDVIIGIESNGIHSNGLSLARKVFFENHAFKATETIAPLDRSIGEELLRPTHIYVSEVLDILNQGIPVKALIHITSDGFLNLRRVEARVSFVIDNLPPPPQIFPLIQHLSEAQLPEMFRVYNMGIGFCVIVRPEDAERVVAIVDRHGKKAYRIGRVNDDPREYVYIKNPQLIGFKNHFETIKTSEEDVIDRRRAIARLQDLLVEAASLQGEPGKLEHFHEWYQRAVEALAAIFGSEDQILGAFQHIQFGVPPEYMRQVGEKRRADMQRQVSFPVPDFAIPQAYLTALPGMTQACELLQSATQLLSSV